MVRFIIRLDTYRLQYAERIYIPIWLDLLWDYQYNSDYHDVNLHSNMVRFIIDNMSYRINKNIEYLHSNMVRFIISILNSAFTIPLIFTFQYG